jgi:hypothetical protein
MTLTQAERRVRQARRWARRAGPGFKAIAKQRLREAVLEALKLSARK